jgi:hypothetical protein
VLEQQRHRLDDEEVDDRGDHQEGEQRVQEVAVGKARAVDREGQAAEVGLAADRRYQGSDEVAHDRAHQGAEGAADDHRDGQVDEVAAQHELPESLHAASLRRGGSSTLRP